MRAPRNALARRGRSRSAAVGPMPVAPPGRHGISGRPSSLGRASRDQTFCDNSFDDNMTISLRLHAERSTSSSLLPHGLDRGWATLGENQDAVPRFPGRNQCRLLRGALVTGHPLATLIARPYAQHRELLTRIADASCRLGGMTCVLTFHSSNRCPPTMKVHGDVPRMSRSMQRCPTSQATQQDA